MTLIEKYDCYINYLSSDVCSSVEHVSDAWLTGYRSVQFRTVLETQCMVYLVRASRVMIRNWVF